MKKAGILLGLVALLNLVYAAGVFAADRDLPWHLMKGSTFIGADVENPQGQDLGDIKDIVIDTIPVFYHKQINVSQTTILNC